MITIAQKPQSKQQKLDLARAQSDVPQLSVIGKVSKRKLFLDGLNPNIEDKDLLYFMSKYGPVIEAIVQTSTSSPNICAYVIMADEKVRGGGRDRGNGDWRRESRGHVGKERIVVCKTQKITLTRAHPFVHSRTQLTS